MEVGQGAQDSLETGHMLHSGCQSYWSYHPPSWQHPGQWPRVHNLSQPLAQVNADPKSQWKQGNHQIGSKRNICADLLLTPESLMGTHLCLCCHLGKWVPARPQSSVLALLPAFLLTTLREGEGVFIHIGLLSSNPHTPSIQKTVLRVCDVQVNFQLLSS